MNTLATGQSNRYFRHLRHWLQPLS
jgi:hypothetical protein